ncbi:MAG: hypothetical protein H0V94_01375 [Actinobacteria bacterium]|nr:hypothetical protein [Actinomycetota bacterium]
MEATLMFSSRWFLPAFSLALGLAFLAALWGGGKPVDGLFSLGVMTVFGLLYCSAVGARRSADFGGTAATSGSPASISSQPRSPETF